ncbi:protein-glutamate methylesterase/protein-glutamine glutaminase [Teredinibacter turnerae]|uniref:protein-glutamate methylesterase/protein-glutamine glutaminase n=1 Tax=Teredinibacter turnerae TaxID=2426 RepID=UPI0003756306|nr:chemotaxis response regulator protein-glutamate methylesterase [Teredinibacter turnerae]
MAKRGPVKVLIIDDSALVRALLSEILSGHENIDVVGSASDPYEAREMIKQLNPDVLTLDIEMPRMNGIAFLKNLMRLRPMPVVMISTLTQQGAPATLEALELGAVDFVPKPKTEGAVALEKYSEEIIEKVLCAARANVAPRIEEKKAQTPDSAAATALTYGKTLKPGFLCAIGASTGGTEAIKDVVKSLPANSPAVVIAQHIPAVFSSSFAKRVDTLSAVHVYEAENNQKIEPGSVYIAPGDAHLRVIERQGSYICQLGTDDLINRHRPSVEALFDSVTKHVGAKAMGVILTGMGADGAAALLRMKQAGCVTVAQDEATSVVWGMPGAAVKLGAADQVLPLDKITRYILTRAYQ